jgi:ribonuclease Y
MDALVVVGTAVVAAAIGVAVGFVARGALTGQSLKSAQDKAARIVAEARAQQKDMILEAKDEKLRLQREAEEEARAKRTEIQGLERRLISRDEQLDQRADLLEEKSRKINERERDIERERDELAKLSQERVAALERVSGLSAEDAKAMLLEAIRDEAEHDAVKLARSIERRAREEAQEKAREVIVTAMQRVAADHTAEHTVTVVHLPNDEMKGRIIGREGRNIRALEQATGVDLIIDDTPETVVLSGFDPVRREIAASIPDRLIVDGDPSGSDRGGRPEGHGRGRVQIQEAGEKAAIDAGVHGLTRKGESSSGTRVRTSSGQNVLKHSPRFLESPR